MIIYQAASLWVFESALFRTTSTLFATEDAVFLVDPTWLPHEIEAIKKQVQAIQGTRSLYLIFTHSDYDHIIGYGAFPEAKVIASQAFIEHPTPAKSLAGILDFDDAYYVERDYPIVYPKVDYSIKEDGQQLKIGNTVLHFYLAPGHNPDGIFIIVEKLGLWIAGDYLSNVEFPYLYDSYQRYLDTLSKVDLILAQHQIKLLVPGHGDLAFSPAEIQQRKKDSLAYLADCKTAIEKEISFDLAALLAQYKFPKIMTAFHQANMELIKKELGGNSLL